VLNSRKTQIAVVAWLVETLVVGKAFGAGGAEKKVAATLEAEGCQMLGGRSPKQSTVGRWHRWVIYHADRTDPEHKLYETLTLALKQQHPDHVRWGYQQLELWLTEKARLITCNAYLNSHRGCRLPSTCTVSILAMHEIG
jgi:hypothetical protein